MRNTHLAILRHLPRRPLWKNRKENSKTRPNPPNRLLDFFPFSQKPFRAGTCATLDPEVSF